MASGDGYNFEKTARRGHFYDDGNFSRGAATPLGSSTENLEEHNPSWSPSKMDKGLSLCNLRDCSSPSEPERTTLYKLTSAIEEENWDSDIMKETKPFEQTPSPQMGNVKTLYRWLLDFFEWLSYNSSLSTLFTMLMVGDGMSSPPRENRIPRIFLTSPGGHERRLSPLSPPKSPPRSLGESIARIKAFPKIPKRQFTTPEKSPEKKQLQQPETPPSCKRSLLGTVIEELPCGGFRLPSPSKVARPPRDPFAIPEKFELAPCEAFDLSQSPKNCIFPSLVYGCKTPKDSEDIGQQPSSNREPSPIKCGQPMPVVADCDQSSSPEKDSPTRNLKVPVVTPENQEEVVVCKRLNESDPYQQPALEAMKEFYQVYRQYTGNQDLSISRKLEQMEEFITYVRRKIIFITDVGAIIEKIRISLEVRNSMARINSTIYRLKQLNEKLFAKCDYSYKVYINLRKKPYVRGKESSRLDKIEALRKTTKDLSELLAEATKLITSYRSDKNYVQNFIQNYVYGATF